MSKSIEQLRKLSQNPYYHLTDEEKGLLAEADSKENAQDPKEQESLPKGQSFQGNATVKEIGQLDKQYGDPTVPNSLQSSTSTVKGREDIGTE